MDVFEWIESMTLTEYTVFLIVVCIISFWVGWFIGWFENR
jgi:TRAP-type mannitol/chloroaromatic compound transport system permease large subunit